MNYYALMNDYNSSIIPKYLYATIDIKKQVHADWSWTSSLFSFPYYILDPECPEQIFLLCEKNVGALRFEYYNYGMAHIASNKFMEIIGKFKIATYTSKKLLATSIGTGDILRDDLQYFYFQNVEQFIDMDGSILEKDRLGIAIPHKIKFTDSVKKYDVFAIQETLLGGCIFISESVVDALSKAKIKGIKFVPVDQALDHYCADHRYDIKRNSIRKKPRLP